MQELNAFSCFVFTVILRILKTISMKPSIVGSCLAIANFLIVLLDFVHPVHAECLTVERFGSVDFGGCSAISLTDLGTTSNEQIKIRLARQMDQAIVAYVGAFNTDITYWQIRQTLTAHKLQSGEVFLANLSFVAPTAGNSDLHFIAQRK
jgi:hypothetical protein